MKKCEFCGEEADFEVRGKIVGLTGKGERKIEEVGKDSFYQYGCIDCYIKAGWLLEGNLSSHT